MKSLTLPVIPSVQYKITTACSIALLKRPGSLIIADKITSRSLLTWSWEQGALSGRYDSNHPMPAGSGRAESYNAVLPQIERLTAAMKKMGAERNASVAQIAIAWAIAKGTLPLVGATKVHHVLDAACASDIQLRDEEIILLEQLAAETRVDTRGARKTDGVKPVRNRLS